MASGRLGKQSRLAFVSSGVSNFWILWGHEGFFKDAPSMNFDCMTCNDRENMDNLQYCLKKTFALERQRSIWADRSYFSSQNCSTLLYVVGLRAAFLLASWQRPEWQKTAWTYFSRRSCSSSLHPWTSPITITLPLPISFAESLTCTFGGKGLPAKQHQVVLPAANDCSAELRQQCFGRVKR